MSVSRAGITRSDVTGRGRS